MPKIVDADLQREAIRSAAHRVFAKRGVRGTGLGHVAAAAGMGRSSLYHYYPDKDSLLADMLSELLDRERELFRLCLAGPGAPLARVEELARACAGLFPEWAAFGRTIMDLRLEDARKLARFFRLVRGDLAEVLAAGQRDRSVTRDEDAKVLASLVIGTIDGLLLQHFVEPRSLPSPEALAEALVRSTRRLVAA